MSNVELLSDVITLVRFNVWYLAKGYASSEQLAVINHELVNSIKVVVLTFKLLVVINTSPSVDSYDEIFWIPMIDINLRLQVMKQHSHVVLIVIALWRRLKRLTELIKVLAITKSLVVSLKVNNPTITLLLSDGIGIISGHTEITPRQDLDLINALSLLNHFLLIKLGPYLTVESKLVVCLGRFVDVDE